MDRLKDEWIDTCLNPKEKSGFFSDQNTFWAKKKTPVQLIAEKARNEKHFRNRNALNNNNNNRQRSRRTESWLFKMQH